MSKADELSKKMGQTKPVIFTPRQSVDVKEIPTPKVKLKKSAKVEVASIFAKIPKDDKRWVDHYRVDTGKELGEILVEAIQLLKLKAGRKQ